MSRTGGPSPLDLEEAEVHRAGSRIGLLRRTPHGSLFEYDDAFLATTGLEGGAAVHLPYRARRFETRGVNLHPYFAGLLPEGLRMEALIRRVKTSSDDLFSLLLATGEDTVGDLVVRRPGEVPMPSPPPRPLEETSFRSLFEETLRFSGARAPDPTIPGVQQKLSASMISFPVRLVRGNEAHLLKLTPLDVPRLVQNEAFFMEMARDCGLKVAKTRVVHDRDGEPGLLVTRFDRAWSPKRAELIRLHQEDGCQLLNRYPADKYRLSCNELMEALEVCAAPIPARLRLLQLIAFSYLIGNGDLHAKNVSVVEPEPGGGLQLSPAYDLVSTLPYGDRRMALKLDGRDDGFEGRYLIAFAARFGVREAATRRMLGQLLKKASLWIDRVEEIGLEPKKTRDLMSTMRARQEQLARFEAPGQWRKPAP